MATDEYPATEQADLGRVIGGLAAQPWSTGVVGMYGTSYSGLNSLQVAAERPPALKAVIAIYAVEALEPWLLRWLHEQADGPSWASGVAAAGYERIACPTMLVAGWADGYRNATFRVMERLRVPRRLLFGPGATWPPTPPGRGRGSTWSPRWSAGGTAGCVAAATASRRARR